MLADPYGNRLIAARASIDPDERVKYLLEVCDPCQTVGYTVNGWKVSDFYTPRYFDPVRKPRRSAAHRCRRRSARDPRWRLHHVDRPAGVRALPAAGR